MPSIIGPQHLHSRSQSSEIEKKKFKPTFSATNLTNPQTQKNINLTSFEKQQLFQPPSQKNLKQKPEKKKAFQAPYKQATSDVQITLGGFSSTDKMPSNIQQKEKQDQQQISLNEKQYLPPIHCTDTQQKPINQENDGILTTEDNLKEMLPPLAAKLEFQQGEEKVNIHSGLNLVQLPQKLPIKEQLDYLQKNQEKLMSKKLPNFTQSQESKQHLLKFLVKHCEQQSPSFTKLLPSNFSKRYFGEKERGGFRLGKILEYESGKVEMNIGGVTFMVLEGAKQDFVSEACVIQKPCNSELSEYELIQLGEINNKLVVVPKFH